MSDNFGPLAEWPQKDVHETYSGPATADLYGKLYNYLRVMLRKFLRRIADHETCFRLLHMKKFDHFVKHMPTDWFDRIEVSFDPNIHHCVLRQWHSVELTVVNAGRPRR